MPWNALLLQHTALAAHCTCCTLYMQHTVHAAHSTPLMLHTVHAAHSTSLMLHTVHVAHSTPPMLHTVHAAHSTPFMLHTVHAAHSTPLMLHTVHSHQGLSVGTWHTTTLELISLLGCHIRLALIKICLFLSLELLEMLKHCAPMMSRLLLS